MFNNTNHNTMKKYVYLIKLSVLIILSLIILGLQRAFSQNNNNINDKSLVEVVE